MDPPPGYPIFIYQKVHYLKKNGSNNFSFFSDENNKLCPSVKHPSNNNKINIWCFGFEEELDEKLKNNFMAKKMLSVMVNNQMSSKSEIYFHKIKPEKLSDCSKDNLYRHINDIVEACRNYIYLVFGEVVQIKIVNSFRDMDRI